MSQAVILVGGKGTRLGDLTLNTPKPMLLINGRPFLENVIELVARHGFSDIILLCGYLADEFLPRFDNTVFMGSRVRCVVESQPMGTGGALLQIADILDEYFLLLNGDSLFDFNLLDLYTIAPDSDWIGKVALRPLEDTGRYGVVSIDGDCILSFAEKASSGFGLINGGVYLLNKSVLSYINSIPCSLEHDVLPKVVNDGSLFGRAYDSYFIDIGIPEDLQRARLEFPCRKQSAIFFDRDGVLNYDSGYTHRIEDFQWMPGAIESIKLCNDSGWLVIVVTNQSGIARGFYDESAVFTLHRWMQEHLRQHGAHIDAFYFCPHHPDGVVEGLSFACGCRKPEPGLLTQALQEWPAINVSSSCLIGDKPSDIEAAIRAGICGRLFDAANLLVIVSDTLERAGNITCLNEVV